MRRENNRWAGWNTDYKYHSKNTHFGWKTGKLVTGAFGALGIMGEMAPLVNRVWKCDVIILQTFPFQP